jgi:hypothetical protein
VREISPLAFNQTPFPTPSFHQETHPLLLGVGTSMERFGIFALMGSAACGPAVEINSKQDL